jgi:hypothetical protein
MTRLNRVYPILFATVPILQIATGNPGTWTPLDLAMMLLGAMAAAALVYGVVALVARERWSGQLPALTTSLVVLGFYRYVKTVRWVGRWVGPLAHPVLLAAGLGLGLALVWWLVRRPERAERLGTFLTIMAMLMVGWSLATLVVQRWKDRRVIRESGLVRRLARPIGTRPGGTAAGAPRDIYLIVLDEYANSSVLRERMGFDNRLFEDSLRALGFTIPAVVHSNYAHTGISIPSLLNFSHLPELSSELGPHSLDPTLPNYLVQNNRSVDYLKAHGYRYLLFPSQWWLATGHSPRADVEFQPWHGFSLRRELSHTELRRVIRGQTPIKVVQPDYSADVDYIRRTFAGLAQVSADPTPTFAFAHVINPHTPWIFDRDCRPASRSSAGHNKLERQRRYLEQVNCLNGLVLELVTTLIRTSPEPPIILLQGDHGTNWLNFSDSKTAAAVPVEKIRERMGAFGAYLLPGGGERAFGDSVSIVNVMGNVLRYYFGADTPREADEMYLSLKQSPYLFHRVDRLQ